MPEYELKFIFYTKHDLLTGENMRLVGLLMLTLLVSISLVLPVSLEAKTLYDRYRNDILVQIPREFNFTYSELLMYYRAMTRRWYDASTYKMFLALYGVRGPANPFHGYGILHNIRFTVHEADIIGGVVYLYPPRGLTMYKVEGYEDVYVMYYPNEFPWKLNIPWAVNFMYDYIGFQPKIAMVMSRNNKEYDVLEPDAKYYYSLLAPDYYILEYDYKCVYEFPEVGYENYIFFRIHLDPMRFLCYAPPELNITPKVLVIPELYEELRSKHGVYPIYIWINDKIRYVGILAGLETTIGGVIRPDVHNLIHKYTGLNLTRDYVVFVVVVPMFANRGIYTTKQDNIEHPYVLCSRRGCLHTGLSDSGLGGYDAIGFNYLLDKGCLNGVVPWIREKVNESIPIYFDVFVEDVVLTPFYTYEPRIVVPEGVYHVKPNYTYLLFPYFVRDLRAGNLTLPPPNTERVFINETDVYMDDFLIEPPSTGVSNQTATPTTTQTTAPTPTTTVAPEPPATQVCQTITVTTTIPTTITETQTTTIVIEKLVEKPVPTSVSPSILVLGIMPALIIGFIAGYLIRRK